MIMSMIMNKLNSCQLFAITLTNPKHDLLLNKFYSEEGTEGQGGVPA